MPGTLYWAYIELSYPCVRPDFGEGLTIEPFWAKIAVVCASLPLGATAFVLAQRYKLLEAETSTGAVVSTTASIVTVSLVMALLAGR